MRKLKYSCAVSLDGFVACKDGSYDCFDMEGPHIADFIASFQTFDTALMGRKTYEVGVKLGITNPYPFLETYVFSRTLKNSPDPSVKLVSTDAAELVRSLKQQEGKKDIWLVGAGDFAATLFAAHLIDEVILKVNPLMLGDGIPIVSHLGSFMKFHLLNTKTYENGVVLLSYKVH